MKAVVGLLLLLLRAAHGVFLECDGRQDGAHCYGVVGGTVDIQLLNNVSGILRIELEKESSIILQWRVNDVSNITKYLFIPRNATFRIKNLNKTDSGQYKVQIFNLDGRQAENKSFHLTVEGPSSLFICGIRFGVIILLLIVIYLYFMWKKKRIENLKAVGSQVIEEQEN